MSTPAQRQRHREHREQNRDQILSAAESLLRQRPYRELTVETVMAQTGLSRTAFYRHFDDVADLVLRLLEEVGTELHQVGELWMSQSIDDFTGAAHDGIGGIVDFFVSHGTLVRAVAEGAVSDERIEAGYRRFIETFIAMTTRAFDALVQRGETDPFETHGLARALNLMNESYLLDQLGRTPHGDPEVVAATLETIWLRSIGPVRPVRRD